LGQQPSNPESGSSTGSGLSCPGWFTHGIGRAISTGCHPGTACLYDADFLKIDRSFVSGMDGGVTNTTIVRSTINLGYDLGMRVIGEGIEDAGVLDSLTQMGCDVVQDYLIARPVDLPALENWLEIREH
jgi:hypothetical protein